MKKILALALAMMMLCASAAAEMVEATYYLPEVKARVTLPADYYVLSNYADESVFTALRLDKTSIMEDLLADDTYMAIVDQDGTWELGVVMTANEVDSLGSWSDEQLAQLPPLLEELFAGIGCTVTQGDVYSLNGYNYVRTWYTTGSGAQTTYAMQYYTIENNMGIVWRMISYTDSFTAEMEAQLEEIVSTVTYD